MIELPVKPILPFANAFAAPTEWQAQDISRAAKKLYVPDRAASEIGTCQTAILGVKWTGF
jgi:hypothetical protein